MITVTFKDEGQDFLEWDIEDGVVVGCRPYQDWVWKGTKVTVPEERIRAGVRLSIINTAGVQVRLLHPVESVILNRHIE